MSSSPAASPVHDLFAYLGVPDTGAAIDFYQGAFGATEHFRVVGPSGRIGHAELQHGPAVPMLSDPFPDFGITVPPPAGLP